MSNCSFCWGREGLSIYNGGVDSSSLSFQNSLLSLSSLVPVSRGELFVITEMRNGYLVIVTVMIEDLGN